MIPNFNILNRANIRIAIIAITGLLLFVFEAHSQSKKLFDDNELQCGQQVTIVSSGNLDMGNVLKGTTTYYNDDNVIKFKISSTEKINIRISKYVTSSPNDNTQWSQTWKMGENTGFENTFSHNRVSLKNSNNKTYYVTMQINSIYVPSNGQSGEHKLNITVSVEIDE
jgi:hypothetical protein